MAKLNQIPDSGTIIASRGRVDYYFWMGIPVARSWPRKSTQPRTAAEIRSSELFTAAAVMTGAVAEPVMEISKRLVGGVGVTWVDHFRGLARGKPWVELKF